MRQREKIMFDGIWRKEGEDDIYIFTDYVTGSTFTVVKGEDFIDQLKELRIKHGHSLPDNPGMIFPR